MDLVSQTYKCGQLNLDIMMLPTEDNPAVGSCASNLLMVPNISDQTSAVLGSLSTLGRRHSLKDFANCIRRLKVEDNRPPCRVKGPCSDGSNGGDFEMP